MRDVLWNGVARADVGHANVRRFAGLAQCVVTGIKVLAFLLQRVRIFVISDAYRMEDVCVIP